MKYTFELYILTEQLTAEHWSKLYQALLSRLGVLGKFEITLSCNENVVRFFISCNKDIGPLSNGTEGILLKPAGAEELTVPKTSAKERFLQLVPDGNILDLKEKVAIRSHKDLLFATCKLRAFNSTRAAVVCNLYFKDAHGRWTKASKIMHFFPSTLFAIDFAANARYMKQSIPKFLNVEKSLFMLSSDQTNALFSVDTYPYFMRDYYLHLTSYDFDKHSFIVGASGSGKSKLIGLVVDRLYRTSLKMNYRVIVIDPHSSMAPDLAHITESKVVNFNSESTSLFAGAAADISAATELTTTLFKSLMSDSYNPKVDRLLRFSLFVLFTAQAMSLNSLKRFLTEVDLRNQILEHVNGYIPDNINLFFGADFNDMRTKYYNETISPIVSLVDEMQLQPVLVGEGELSLAKTIQDNFLTVFSLNKVSMGERVVKTVAGLLIQQIFLLAQAKAFSEKIILIIDEVSVVQNPALTAILAEARKFNLTVVLTQQYLGQIEKDLQDAIFANVFNYYAFKVSEEDARLLEGNINIELPKKLIEQGLKSGLKESDMKVALMTDLHPRECLVRVLANGHIVPAIKARTVDAPAAPLSPAGNQLKQGHFEPAKVRLPAKFSESNVPAKPPLPKPQAAIDKPNTSKTTAAEPTHFRTVEPFMGNQLGDKPAGLFNLSELLAEHSSSRLPLKKRKGKTQ